MFHNLICAPCWLLAIGSFSLLAIGQDAVNRPGDEDAMAAQRRFVVQLGDPSYSVRYEAARQLARQGAAAKAVLTEARTNPDPEIRSRARLLLSRMSQEVRAENGVDRNHDHVPTAAQRALVLQLGDRSFSIRERAATKLVGQGAAARAALIEALRDPDCEIRWQARRVLCCLDEKEFEARLTAFMTGVAADRQLSLPGWKRFQQLVGDSRPARKLFVGMTRADAPLLAAYEEESPELPELFLARTS